MERPTPLIRPSKEAIAQLPSYKQLPLNNIHVIRSKTQVEFATRKLAEAKFIGFDTETKPVFTKDTKREGPHVIQLATLEHTFVVQVNIGMHFDFLRNILESNDIVKIGFGLKSDRGPLQKKLGIRLGASVELAQIVKKLGYRQAVGVKAAVAIVLAQRLPKSKKMTLSNWALPRLSPNQLQYAANDAHAALAVFHALGCPYKTANSVLEGAKLG
jgi:ribonuclease D